MTYVSRPVRAMRDDPMPEESVTLLLRLGDANVETTTTRVEDAGATLTPNWRSKRFVSSSRNRPWPTSANSTDYER